MEGLSIVLPIFNEVECIRQFSLECISFLETTNLNYEIIIVNDGSSDASGRIANELARKVEKIKVIHHTTNQGYGYSIRDGFRAARYNLLFFTDSDGQFKIASLEKMLTLIKERDDLDIVIGYRLKRQDPFIRRFFSWVFNLLIKFIFDLNARDINCAFKLFKKEIFSNIEIESERFSVNSEILAKAKIFNYRIFEIGVGHYPRSAGHSTISFKHIPLTLTEIAKVWRSIQKLKKEGSQVK